MKKPRTKPPDPPAEETAYRAALVRWVQFFGMDAACKPNFVTFGLAEGRAREIEREMRGKR